MLGPLHEPLFRTLWIAAVISYTGTWMQNVGAAWLMTSLTMSPLMVGLVQAAGSIAVFLVVLPAGAIADMVDRRKLLLFTQSWMVLAAAALGVLTLAGKINADTALITDTADGLRRGAERSCLAGDHARNRFASELRSGHCAEFRGIQCRARDWSCAGRPGDCRGRFGHRVSVECALVLRRDLLPLPLAAPAGTHVVSRRTHDSRNV